MTNQKQSEPDVVNEVVKTVKSTNLYDISRKVLLAGAGAAGLASDEIKAFVDRMVERGEIAEQDARRLMVEALEKREQTARKKNKTETPKSTVTKADIEALSARILELSRMVEELKGERDSEAAEAEE